MSRKTISGVMIRDHIYIYTLHTYILILHTNIYNMSHVTFQKHGLSLVILHDHDMKKIRCLKMKTLIRMLISLF